MEEEVDFGWDVLLIFFDKCFVCYGFDVLDEDLLWFDFFVGVMEDCGGYYVIDIDYLEESEVLLWIVSEDDLMFLFDVEK